MAAVIKGVQAQVEREADEACAEAGQLTLGELEARLEPVNKSLPVFFDSGESPGEFMSYRGYYRYVAVAPTDEPCTAGEFLERFSFAIGGTFTGYKGGEYRMTRHTPVWVSRYGEASGVGIVGVAVLPDKVILVTAKIEED